LDQGARTPFVDVYHFQSPIPGKTQLKNGNYEVASAIFFSLLAGFTKTHTSRDL